MSITSKTIFIVLLVCLNACKAYEKEKKAHNLHDQCMKIKIGMSDQELYTVMGKPLTVSNDFIRNGTVKIRYYYASPALASTSVHCIIDKKTRTVEEVVCGE